MSDTVQFTIQINDRASGSLSNIGNAFDKLKVRFSRVAGWSFAFNQFGDAIRNFSQMMDSLTKPGQEFEQKMADLQAITGIAGKDLEELGDTARKMGVGSGLGASEAVEAYKLLASNIDVSTIGGVKGFERLQKATIALAQAGGVDLSTAADTMSFAINQFGLGGEDANRVINVLAAGAKFGAA